MFYALKFSRVQMSSVNRLRFGRQPPLTVSRTSHKSLTDSDGIRTFGRNVSSLNVLTVVMQFIEAKACVVAMIIYYIYLLLFLVFENNLFHLWYFKSNFYGCYIWIVVFLHHCYRSQKEKIGYMNNTRLIIFNPLLFIFLLWNSIGRLHVGFAFVINFLFAVLIHNNTPDKLFANENVLYFYFGRCSILLQIIWSTYRSMFLCVCVCKYFML